MTRAGSANVAQEGAAVKVVVIGPRLASENPANFMSEGMLY